MSVLLRSMEPSDIATVAALEAAVSPEPWSVGLFEGEFTVDRSTRHWVVAVADGAVAGGEGAADTGIIGFAGMMFVGLGDAEAEGHLMNIAVAPVARRTGIASQLCDELFRFAAGVGVDAITLEVRVSNVGAIGLYRSFGFAPVGNRPSYYSNPDGTREDGLIFWLHDNVARTAARSETA